MVRLQMRQLPTGAQITYMLTAIGHCNTFNNKENPCRIVVSLFPIICVNVLTNFVRLYVFNCLF